MIDSRAILGLLKSATRRSMLTMLVALSIAVNAATGGFAGVVHDHEHEHGQQHAHGHGDDHKHLDDHDDDTVTLAASRSDDGNSPRDHHDTLHEHGAIVVLALVQVGSMAPVDIGSSPGIRPDPGAMSDVKHQLERPPRRA